MHTVLFDMFRVIARHQSPQSKEHLVAVADLASPAFWEAYWQLRRPYDRGDVTGPQYWDAVARRLGTSFSDERIADLIQADLAGWSAVDASMVDLVEELADAGRDIALLSNIPEEPAAYYEDRHPWLDRFSVLGFSCRIGHAKPEAGAYQWCGRALGREPGQILFVDDRAENIAAARSLGMRGHLFTSLARLRTALTLWEPVPATTAEGPRSW
ncbi:HAD family hydrolase [Streptomyces brevispora]|uniref:HAD family hydrolase n=1 Tax=Streptomyces brevispora TaxID=887462 RepID=UPI00371B9E3A